MMIYIQISYYIITRVVNHDHFDTQSKSIPFSTFSNQNTPLFKQLTVTLVMMMLLLFCCLQLGHQSSNPSLLCCYSTILRTCVQLHTHLDFTELKPSLTPDPPPLFSLRNVAGSAILKICFDICVMLIKYEIYQPKMLN